MVMVSCRLRSGCCEPDWCEEFDLNQDSVVNFEDFVLQGKCLCRVRRVSGWECELNDGLA